MSENKDLINKAKQLLSEYGYDVKTSHLYEVFSKLAGEASWNVASAKKTNLDKILGLFKEPTIKEVSQLTGSDLWKLNRKTFLKALDENELVDKLVLGYLSRTNELVGVRPVQQPHVLFAGCMGSGKSSSGFFSTLMWLLANSDQTRIFIFDPYKSATDFKHLFELEQVRLGLNSKSQIIKGIDMFYEEALTRLKAFNKVEAEHIQDYEKKTSKKLDRILLVYEEFHGIAEPILNFSNDFETPDTPAFKFHQIMRLGRSLGINILAITPRVHNEDVHPKLMVNFLHKQAFRVTAKESQYLLNDTSAASIRSDQKGFCKTDYGQMQVPYLFEEEIKSLIKKYLLSRKSQSLYLTDDMVRQAFPK